LRICFISNCPRIGGAERVLLETIDVLSHRGVECKVLLPTEGQFSEELARRGIDFEVVRSAALTMTGQPTLWKRIKAVVRFTLATVAATRSVARWKCDAIYSNTLTVCHGAVVAKLLNKPHIWHLHEFGKEDHGFGFYFGERFTFRTVASLSTVCIAVSKALVAKYQKFIPIAKLTVLYPSMHLELERMGQSQESRSGTRDRGAQFQCIIVGGVFAGKRQEDAVGAFALLRKSGIDARLVIVGGLEDTLYVKQLEEAIRTSKLEDDVILTGEVRDARDHIRESDVLLVCSRSEAFGRVTIEAMLEGKPVIGAAAGATPELIRDGFSGLIYKLADAQSLADKITNLFEHPEITSRLGKNGQQWAKTIFTKERYSAELFAILDAALSQARPQSEPSPEIE
jgi:glycosyltransferase involved in cell wall biosynthesis